MSFIEIEFALFLGLAVYAYYRTPPRYRKICLAAISCLFYLTWSVKGALLLLTITAVAYQAAIRLEEARTERQKSLYLSIILGTPLMCLLFFKSLAPFSHAFLPSPINLAVPLGLSYYSFKIMSYGLDIFWGRIKSERDFASFAAYVAFFPHILSGPIQRAGDFLSQLRGEREISQERIVSGLRLFLFGLFKKVVVADTLGPHVDTLYRRIGYMYGVPYFVSVYFFAFQLYADFSGLTDMAIGIGRLFGINSPKNFNNPFYAPNIQEFWRRWHKTLTPGCPTICLRP